MVPASHGQLAGTRWSWATASGGLRSQNRVRPAPAHRPLPLLPHFTDAGRISRRPIAGVPQRGRSRHRRRCHSSVGHKVMRLLPFLAPIGSTLTSMPARSPDTLATIETERQRGAVLSCGAGNTVSCRPEGGQAHVGGGAVNEEQPIAPMPARKERYSNRRIYNNGTLPGFIPPQTGGSMRVRARRAILALPILLSGLVTIVGLPAQATPVPGATSLASVHAVSSLTAAQPNTVVSLYRLWHRSTGHHFYTTSWAGAVNAFNNLGYTYEGVCCHVLSADSAYGAPLYRLYRPANDDHFYTTNWAEAVNAFNNLGYRYEGIQAYVQP